MTDGKIRDILKGGREGNIPKAKLPKIPGNIRATICGGAVLAPPVVPVQRPLWGAVTYGVTYATVYGGTSGATTGGARLRRAPLLSSIVGACGARLVYYTP